MSGTSAGTISSGGGATSCVTRTVTQEYSATSIATIHYPLNFQPYGAIRFYRNGVLQPESAILYSPTTSLVRYIAANNGDEGIVANDRIVIVYEWLECGAEGPPASFCDQITALPDGGTVG